jgi:hypothetical protein
MLKPRLMPRPDAMTGGRGARGARLPAGSRGIYGWIKHAAVGGLMLRMSGWLVIIVAFVATADPGRAQSNSPDAWKANLDKEQVQHMEVVIQRGRRKA